MHNKLLSCVIFFDFTLDVLIVVYARRVFHTEVTVDIYFFFCVPLTISINAFYFINTVIVYKAVMV